MRFIPLQRTLLFLVLLVAQASLITPKSVAAPKAKATNTALDSQLAALKAQYLTLRNTDVELRRSKEWLALAEKFELFVDKNPQDSGAPSALYDASILYEHYFRKLGGEDRLEQAIKLLARLSTNYPTDALADDALVKRAELFISERKDFDSAQRIFEEVKRRFPSSDMAAVAKSRLKAIEDGSIVNPKGDLKNLEDSVPEDGLGQLTKQKGRSRVVVIDPGHGGEDYGAVGQGSLLEKDVVLDVAFELEKLLKNEPGIIVRLTRRKDVFVPLAERTSLANDFDADVLVSLHANASPSQKLSGLQTFYLDNSGDAASRKLAERENASVRFEGPQGDLPFMLSDLIQNAKLDDSVLLARSLNESVRTQIVANWGEATNLGVKKAPFYVLVGAHMPCALVEMFFIDNAVDGKRLANGKFRKDLALGVFKGIKRYFQEVKDVH